MYSETYICVKCSNFFKSYELAKPICKSCFDKNIINKQKLIVEKIVSIIDNADFYTDYQCELREELKTNITDVIVKNINLENI